MYSTKNAREAPYVPAEKPKIHKAYNSSAQIPSYFVFPLHAELFSHHSWYLGRFSFVVAVDEVSRVDKLQETGQQVHIKRCVYLMQT